MDPLLGLHIPNHQLTTAQRAAIIAVYGATRNQSETARRLGLARTTVRGLPQTLKCHAITRTLTTSGSTKDYYWTAYSFQNRRLAEISQNHGHSKRTINR